MLIGIVVLLSTTGLPRVQHLCGGIVQSAGIWGSSGCNHEKASIHSRTAHAPVVNEKPASSCCKKTAVAESDQKKGCCTNQVDWEPSQLDLAVGDDLVLEGQVSFVFSHASYVARIPVSSEDLNPYVRPPPQIPIPQSRRRALLQVYRC